MKQLSLPTKEINLTGMFIGIYLADRQPVLFSTEGVVFLPIFSTPEKYEQAMARIVLDAPAKIQVIMDHAEFLEDVHGKIRLMLDPWINEQGNTRFTELKNGMPGEFQ